MNAIGYQSFFAYSTNKGGETAGTVARASKSVISKGAETSGTVAALSSYGSSSGGCSSGSSSFSAIA